MVLLTQTIATGPRSPTWRSIATHGLHTSTASHLSLFTWFTRNSSTPTPTHTPLYPIPSANTPALDSRTNMSSDPTAIATNTISSPPVANTNQIPLAPASTVIKGKMLARDAELLQKLLDREGGSAGVSIVNGRYEEGLGPETKKNMFRLI